MVSGLGEAGNEVQGEGSKCLGGARCSRHREAHHVAHCDMAHVVAETSESANGGTPQHWRLMMVKVVMMKMRMLVIGGGG